MLLSYKLIDEMHRLLTYLEPLILLVCQFRIFNSFNLIFGCLREKYFYSFFRFNCNNGKNGKDTGSKKDAPQDVWFFHLSLLFRKNQVLGVKIEKKVIIWFLVKIAPFEHFFSFFLVFLTSKLAFFKNNNKNFEHLIVLYGASFFFNLRCFSKIYVDF